MAKANEQTGQTPEIQFTQDEQDALISILAKARVAKGKRLAADEENEIVKEYTEKVRAERKSASEKEIQEKTEAEAIRQRRVDVMMPSEKKNVAKL